MHAGEVMAAQGILYSGEDTLVTLDVCRTTSLFKVSHRKP